MEWVYHNDRDNSVRYTLGIKGNNPLICFGINPSTACPGNVDNTIRSVERHAFGKGFDSWIMLNLYPLRMTNPDLLPQVIDQDIHRNNIGHIGQLFSSRKIKIWAAWGTLITKRDYLRNCLKDILEVSARFDCEWYSIGRKSKQGHPHHPLYLRSDETMDLFDVNEYMKGLG
jgi:hypothetical protein